MNTIYIGTKLFGEARLKVMRAYEVVDVHSYD